MHDILIIGGGIAGLSAAAYLAEGAKVCLLEAEDQLSYHASGRSAALYLGTYGNDVIRALNKATLPHLQQADGGVLSPRAMMMIATPEDRALALAEAKESGLNDISLSQALELVPILNIDKIGFAAMRDDAFDIDTDLLLQNYTRRARQNGAEITTNARVTGLARVSRGWRVTTSAGEFEARTIVNAAGAWADEIAKLVGLAPLGIQPYRRSMARLAPPKGLDVSAWPALEEVGEKWYAKPDAGSLIVSPADADPVAASDAWADDMVLAEGLACYEEMVTAPVTRPQATWAGLRSFASDKTLVIGHAGSDPSFFWLAGQGGYGFQTCDAAARLTADLLLERSSELPQDIVNALSPRRLEEAAKV